MPSKRTRRQRGGAASYPEELHWTFEMGTGWNHYDQDWLAEQWREYREAFLARRPKWRRERGPCFAEVIENAD